MHPFILPESETIVSPNSILSGSTIHLKKSNELFVFTWFGIRPFPIKEGGKVASTDFGFSSPKKENDTIT